LTASSDQTPGMDQKAMNDFWLRAANEIGSFKQMYALANEIAGSSHSSKKSRRAARRVTGELSPVIDKAIAPADQLAKARRHFDELKQCLSMAA
jgi:hypothetical protein